METKKDNEWIENLRKANCSALIKIKNRTGDTLIRTDFLLPSGMWREFPPETIEPGAEGWFGTESLGFCTGTEGTVQYQIAKGLEPFQFQWEVPFVGSPKVKAEAGKNYRIGKEVETSNKVFIVEFSVHDPFEGDYRHNNSNDAKIVTEPPVIYESWKLELKNAFRSLLVSFDNLTDFVLKLKLDKLVHGIRRYPAPKEIKPQSTVDFGVESHGLFGTKGELVYCLQIDDLTYDITFTWDVPIVGSPSFHSNMLTIDPHVIGNHCEVMLHFSSDELFVIEKRKEGVETQRKSTDNNSEKSERFAETSYGFET